MVCRKFSDTKEDRAFVVAIHRYKKAYNNFLTLHIDVMAGNHHHTYDYPSILCVILELMHRYDKLPL